MVWYSGETNPPSKNCVRVCKGYPLISTVSGKVNVRSFETLKTPPEPLKKHCFVNNFLCAILPVIETFKCFSSKRSMKGSKFVEIFAFNRFTQDMYLSLIFMTHFAIEPTTCFTTLALQH